jgi:uncharacterized membrane protein YcaP (DUF421 family)
METFLRTLTIYLFLLFLFRVTGKRTLSEISTFDFILLLIIGEATQNALIGEDYSLVTGMSVILTLGMLDLGLSVLKKRYKTIEKITEGTPLVLVSHGEVLEDYLAKTHVTEDDILQSARISQGLERMAQIKYAVLEPSGGISIIPMELDIEEKLDRRIHAALLRVMNGSQLNRPAGEV